MCVTVYLNRQFYIFDLQQSQKQLLETVLKKNTENIDKTRRKTPVKLLFFNNFLKNGIR